MSNLVKNAASEQSEPEKLKERIKEITKPIEANIIGILWKDPQLYFDYSELNRKMFKSAIWEFYFTIGLKIVQKGISKIDDVAVELYLKDYPNTLKAYKEYGGYDPIDKLLDFATVENAEGYIDDLKKWDALYSVVENMTITEKSIHDVKDMDINELYDYFNAQMNNIFINADDGVEASGIEVGIDEMIADADKGLMVGMPIPSEILSEEIGGVMRGQIIMCGGLSGAGKTTFTIQMILSATFENEEPLVVMLNEQDKAKWQQELLTWIINNKMLKTGDKKFNKKRWRQGEFTDLEKKQLSSASKYLKDKMENNQIIIIHFKSYSRKQAERIIRKYASLGVINFVLDTFKMSSDRANDEAFWLSMQEDMRKYDDLVKPSNLNVNLWATLQLQKGSALRRYLTGDNIGMAKNTIDVCSVGLLMRRVRNDEYTGEKNAILVKKPVIQGNLTSGITVDLDPNKKYLIIFIEKNRNGESQSYQIVAEQHLGHLTYKEIGVCDIPFDS